MTDEDVYRCCLCGAWTAYDRYCGHCAQIEHGRCLFCDRPMRRRTWPKVQGFITYGGRGYCVTHYHTVSSYGEEALEAELDAAVESYWQKRVFVLAERRADVEHA